MKKFLSMSLTALLISCSLAGCSTKKASTDIPGADGVTLTIHAGTVEAGPYNGDWPIFVEAAKKTGVKLKGTMPDTVTNFSQEMSLMLASGELSDIVMTSNLEFFNYGKEGAFEPLDDLIDEYAPHIKAFFEENPEVKEMATGPDGKIWFIPFVQDGVAQAGWFIRKDWLDKLGLAVPETLADYQKTLTAFANEDPNGNGKKDEIPYFHRSSVEGINGLLSLWAAHPSFYVKDGQVGYGPLDDSYKLAYENIKQWYNDKLIDPEMFTRANARDVLLAENIGGSTHDLFGSTGNYNTKLADKIPDFDFSPMAPPANSEGNKVEPTKRKIARTYGWGMSASNAHKEETIKYFDYWFTEEGRRMANFGIEGDTYEMVDGKPILTDKVLNGGKPAIDIVRETGAQSNFGFQQDYAFEEQWTTDVALKGISDYVENNYFEEQFPDVKFNEETQKNINKLLPKISTYIGETTQQWVLGAKEIDFDKFTAELSRLGADELVKYYQEAYAQYIKALKNE